MKYDFIEIGTCDYDTLSHFATDKYFEGLMVDPLKNYLDALPNHPCIKKVNCAVSDTDKNMLIFFVDLKTIKEYEFPIWFKASSSLNSINPLVEEYLLKEGLNPQEIISKKTVRCISFDTLIKENNITGVEFLKVDAETDTLKVIKNYLKCCLSNNELFASDIFFELNNIFNDNEKAKIMNALKINGYKLFKKDEFNVHVIKPNIPSSVRRAFFVDKITDNKKSKKAWYHGLEGSWWWGMDEEQFLEKIFIGDECIIP